MTVSHVKQCATPVCTKCGKEPRAPGQRWGLNCHKRYMRKHRREAQRNRSKNRKVGIAGLAAKYVREPQP